VVVDAIDASCLVKQSDDTLFAVCSDAVMILLSVMMDFFLFSFPTTSTIFPSSNYTTFLLTTSCRPSLCLALDIRCSILIACVTLALVFYENTLVAVDKMVLVSRRL